MPAKKVAVKKSARGGRSPHVASAARPASKKALDARRSSLSVRRTSVAKSKTKSVRKSASSPLASGRSSAPKLSASVYDLKGKAIGRVTLPSEVFGVEENPHLLAQAVRVYLANQRQGTVSTKTRGEVQGSTRKIYRQKGTGRARHGGIRAPIFVHGGIVFGPKPREFSLSMPQKMRRLALFTALSGKVKDGELKI